MKNITLNMTSKLRTDSRTIDFYLDMVANIVLAVTLGSYRNMKTKFQDFSRIIPGLFSVFKDSISLTHFNIPSDFYTVFFCASHKSKRIEKNQCVLVFSRTISQF